MQKSINVELKLLQKARRACSARTYAETVQKALEALILHDAYEKIRAFRGSESKSSPPPRRRQAPGIPVAA